MSGHDMSSYSPAKLAVSLVVSSTHSAAQVTHLRPAHQAIRLNVTTCLLCATLHPDSLDNVTTCLLCATLHPDSQDARIFALQIADTSTFHALHCRRAVFEPSRMLVHLCGTLPVHLKNRNLTLTTFMRHFKSYLFSQH